LNKEDPFRVEFSGDDSIGVEFSDQFLSLSVEGQIQALEALFSEKMSKPISTQDVSKAAAENEIVIIFLEILLARLKRGERIENDSDINVSISELIASDDLRVM
jgi:hypothetical protein